MPQGNRKRDWPLKSPGQCADVGRGKIYASIVDAATYYECYKVEDTVRGTIEVKIRKAVRWVDDAALRHSVAKEVRAERELTRRKKAQEWEGAKKNKDALLAQLTAFEKMAKDLDRARSLRRFIDEVAASPAAPAELVGNGNTKSGADARPASEAPRQQRPEAGILVKKNPPTEGGINPILLRELEETSEVCCTATYSANHCL